MNGQTKGTKVALRSGVSSRLVVSIAFTLAAGCAVDPTTGSVTDAVKVCARGTTVQGIDVSTYQGNIDWAAVKASGVDFTFIRSSDGLTHPDSKFAKNWAGAKSAGVIRGVYQFFQPGEDAIAQADMMLDAMGPLDAGDLPPVIDVEATGGQTPAVVAAGVKAWVEHVAAKTGRTPIIYSGKYFWNDNVGTDMTAYPLWIPAYGPVCPDLPNPWQDWAFFQYASTGSVPGISGNVDMDYWNGDLASLVGFTQVTTVCGDGVCSAAESTASCAADCPPCGVIDPLGGIIDDGDACFTGGGDPQYLRAVSDAGYDGDLLWTHTTDSATEANYGEWTLFLAEAGRYRIEVYTAAAAAQSKQAAYLVTHAGAADSVTIDQTAVDGWQTLGDFALAAGGDQAVRLNDNTGEPGAGNIQLAFDAIRLTRLDPTDPGTGSGSGSGSGGGDGGSVTSGCSASGGGSGALFGVAVLLGGVRRRRRAPR
jgi:lysozyme